jgi:hypothetical protein
MKTKRMPATRKSRKQDMIEAMGNISRGKYILVMRLLLLIRLGIAKVREDAKNDHGNNEQYEKIGYGVSPVCTCKNFEKTAVNININDKGWIIAQVVPKRDCLYRALMSRRAIFMRSS